MPENRDDDLAKLVLEGGKATPEQVAEARGLAAKMRELGLEKDVLDALVERGVIAGDKAASLRSGESGEAETLQVAPDPFAPAPAARPASAGGGRPSPSQLPPCPNHPYMPGIYKCAVCGRSICMQCAVRTSRGIYCSQKCMAEVSLARGAAVVTGGLAERLRVKQVVIGAAAVAVLALVVIWAVGPSAELSRARELKAGTERLEGEKRPQEALALAQDLATMGMVTGEIELRDLLEWGEARVDMLRVEVAQAELDSLRQGRAGIETLDPPQLAGYRRELEGLAARHADLPAAREAAKGLVARIDARLARIEKDRRDAAAGAILAATRTALEGVTREAEALMANARYGHALAAVDRRRAGAPDSFGPEFGAKLDGLKERITSEAKASFARRKEAAKTLVWRKRYGEAQKIFRDVIATFGIDEITRQARRSLDEVYAVQVAARGATKRDDPGPSPRRSGFGRAGGRGEEERPGPTPSAEPAGAAARLPVPPDGPKSSKRDDLDRVNRALAVVEEKLKALDYVGAQLEIEEATPAVKEKEAAERLGVIGESVRRDEEAFLAIHEMIRKKPVLLARIKSGATGKIADADPTRYTVRVGESSYKMPWKRMPAGEICRLAEMAASEDVESLVDLALFCAGRGSYRDYMKARGRALTAGRGGKDPLARFRVRFDGLKGKSGGGGPDGAPRGKGEPSGEDAGGLEITEGGRKGGEADETPKTIDAECPYCEGSGKISSIGCTGCAGSGIVAKADAGRCPTCNAGGRMDYACGRCRGRGKLAYGGKTIECPVCRGKGHPSCTGCRGTGSFKVPNPDACPVQTVTCPACDGRRFLTKVKCKRCGGKGARTMTRAITETVFETYTVSCVFCDANGAGVPVCQSCSGKAYAGSRQNPVPCARCSGTGHVFLPCRTCAGRGWMPTRTRKK